MRTILFILQKEFLQIFRNRMMLPIIFVIPVIQLLILSYAATYEMKNIRISIVDLDQSVFSRELTAKFKSSPFYTIADYSFSYEQSLKGIENGKADLIMEIPSGFEENLINEKKQKVSLVIDAINGSAANLINAYTLAIVNDFNKNLVTEITGKKIKEPINVEYSYWFNPQLDYITYMVPGILVLLVTIIGIFLSGMNVVREKEIGTIEQLNVTPIKKYQFIIGKLLPFWIIALVELAIGLIIAKLVFNIPIVGSIALIFFVAAVYLLAILALGMLISTVSNTMQQSMFLSWFFMVIFILMSGLFTSVDSMPEWAKLINIINPIAYFIEIIRMIMLKGSTFDNITRQFTALVIYSFVALALAVWRYRKVT